MTTMDKLMNEGKPETGSLALLRVDIFLLVLVIRIMMTTMTISCHSINHLPLEDNHHPDSLQEDRPQFDHLQEDNSLEVEFLSLEQVKERKEFFYKLSSESPSPKSKVEVQSKV